MKKEIIDTTNQLDLNTTARRDDKTLDKFSPYMSHMTYAVLEAKLAYPIGSFDEKKETADATLISSDSRPDANQEEDQLSQQKKADGPDFSLLKLAENPADAVYQRMVIVVPYRSPDKVKMIENTFEQLNLEGLGLSNTRYLNTYELTDEDKVNKELDFLGGFELIDKEMRLYVIEGLGGEGHAMDRFYRANERQHTNDKRFKMLYNPNIMFKNRMYTVFNTAIKKIKLRDTLSETIAVSDIYLRSKVPEDMYQTLQKFAEIRKLDR